MNEREFIERMKAILDNENISMDSILSEIEEWDSLSVVSYAAMANSAFHKNISPEQIKTCNSIRDLYIILQ